MVATSSFLVVSEHRSAEAKDREAFSLPFSESIVGVICVEDVVVVVVRQCEYWLLHQLCL